MSEVKRWDASQPADGVMTVDVTSWKYFVEFIHEQALDLPAYVWRGHRRDDWKLIATLYRDHPEFVEDDRSARHLHHMRAFRYAVRGRRGNNPPAIPKEKDWWALGQAHGLATPLLDWTASPFTAAYFAFCKEGAKGDRTDRRVVYGLHRGLVDERWLGQRVQQFAALDLARGGAKETSKPAPDPTPSLPVDARERREENRRRLLAERKKEARRRFLAESAERERLEQGRAQRDADNPSLSFVRPMTDDNARLINQSGLFTRAPNGEDVTPFVQRLFGGKASAALIRLSIPNSERVTALLALNRMNINHLTLFPDLYGASVFCNLALEIDGYSDFGEAYISDLEP